jgi:GR25 family glycosyltransferase involved in LPS biosynthesis
MNIDFYVINLDINPERMKNYINKHFSKDFNIIRIEAIQKNPGYQGCFLSHQKCIQIAKEKNLPYIIVLEDDTIPFDNNFKERFLIIKEFLDNNNNWDIFLGNGYLGKQTIGDLKIYETFNFKNEKFYLINRSKSTNFIIYNKSSYDYFLNIKVPVPIDACWFDNLKAIIPAKFITLTAKCKSQITGLTIDHTKKFKEFMNFLEKIN